MRKRFLAFGVIGLGFAALAFPNKSFAWWPIAQGDMNPSSYFGRFGWLSDDLEEAGECALKSYDEPSGTLTHTATFHHLSSSGTAQYDFACRLDKQGEPVDLPTFYYNDVLVTPTITPYGPFVGGVDTRTIYAGSEELQGYANTLRYLSSHAPVTEHIVTFAPLEQSAEVMVTGADALFWDGPAGGCNHRTEGLEIRSPSIKSEVSESVRFYSVNGQINISPAYAPYVESVVEHEATLDDVLSYFAEHNGVSAKFVLYSMACQNDGISNVYWFDNPFPNPEENDVWKSSMVFHASFPYVVSDAPKDVIKVVRKGAMRRSTDSIQGSLGVSMPSQNATLRVTFEEAIEDGFFVVNDARRVGELQVEAQGNAPMISLARGSQPVYPDTTRISNPSPYYYAGSGTASFVGTVLFPPLGLILLGASAFTRDLGMIVGASAGLIAVIIASILIGIKMSKRRKGPRS